MVVRVAKEAVQVLHALTNKNNGKKARSFYCNPGLPIAMQILLSNWQKQDGKNDMGNSKKDCRFSHVIAH